MENLNENDIKDEEEFEYGTNSDKLFSKDMIHAYTMAFLKLVGIIGMYYILSSMAMSLSMPSGGSGMGPPSGPPPLDDVTANSTSVLPPPDGGGVGGNLAGLEIWPVWGSFSWPSGSEFLIFLGIALGFGVYLHMLYKKKIKPHYLIVSLVGLILIILTNIIPGWAEGISGAIGNDISAGSELYNDALGVTNFWDFIRNYNDLQLGLGIHARTHPPGAVLVTYLFYLVFGSPGYVALAFCIISTFLTCFYLEKIYKRYFGEKMSLFMVLLFLLLPAIQVYYLANIYSFVNVCVLAALYYYFHEDKKKRIIGTTLSFCVGLFISFMYGFVILMLLIYEIFNSEWAKEKRASIFTRIKNIIINCKDLILISIITIGVYGLLWVIMDFNYLSSFFTAASAESGEGFKLFTNPGEYISTRIKNVMDILVFFGPILLVLFYQGYQHLKYSIDKDSHKRKLYFLTKAAIWALLIIFLTGAYDHGETARAAIYIYIFLLIPVGVQIKNEKYSMREKIILLAVVFGQALLMQLFGNFVW